ncbi:ATP-binding protein [Thalassobacillus sp. CUG 92003]|uniref:ATP-binding protein n=1 Tax=Thalassobacillus sp. CUG 92003 TaxID=2736641 RepID=UPI0015E70C38|nr:ATP-binding protein [Thalassobacillus sp. CUG 92003]
MSQSNQANERPHDQNASHKGSDGMAFMPDYFLDWVVANTNDIMALLDASGEILYISPSVKEALGYDPDEMIGQSASLFISTTGFTELQHHMINTPELSHTSDCALLCSNKRYRRARVQIKLNYDKSRHDYAIMVLAKPISDEDKLLKVEQMVNTGQLAAGIVHEIRNPLTSIKGFLQLLQTNISSKEQYYRIMEEEIEKMENVTGELLSFSKPVSQQMNLETLSDMIEEVVLLLQTESSRNDVQLHVHVEEMIEVHVNRSQFKQVLLNLIKNAIEVMPGGGHVNILAYYGRDKVHVDVMDEGPGIPPEIKDRVLEPFFTTKPNGTGLGLMISEQILQKQGGYLKISQNSQQGSTFSIQLPIMKNNQGA